MFHTYFTASQLLSFVPGVLLILISIFIFRIRQQPRAALILLFFGAAALRVSCALLDPFIHMWDEQYHALVARNMMNDPFNPRLYADPVLPYDFREWNANEIWLHKQPLFMWQIALSFKAFGISEFALRLPSIIMSSIMVLFIYRMGKLSVNERVGYYAAFLWSLNYFSLTLVSGAYTCDHNDVAFVFYVTASLWAWTEYIHSGKRHWILLIGLFVGMGVLVKWLTAFLVFSGWGLAVLLDGKRRKSLRAWVDMGLSFALAIAVFLPWQLYILHKYPDIARHNYALNSAHFTDAVHGHSGDMLYYWHNLRLLYGDLVIVPPLIVLCLVILWRRIVRKEYRLAYFTWLIFLYGFFTLAATKMGAFTLPVSSVVLIGIGTGIDSLLRWAGSKMKRVPVYFVSVILLLAAGILVFNAEEQQRSHTPWQDKTGYRMMRESDTKMFKRLPEQLPAGAGKWVIFGCRFSENILVMFYTGYVAYDMVPDNALVSMLKAKGYRVAAYDYFWLTDEIRNNPDVVKLKPDMP
jgi:4-amino-4-deoxy-L-arabinose transferase-like glycosyltransferase